MPTSPIPTVVRYDGGVLFIEGPLTAPTVGAAERGMKKIPPGDVRVVDGAGVSVLDTTGAVFIRRIAGSHAEFRGFAPEAATLLRLVDIPTPPATVAAHSREPMTLERFGGMAIRALDHLTEVAVLVVDILYWSVVGIADRRQYRKGSFTEQAFYIGSSALPIVGTILFLIGLILALQSAAQLRQFGAVVYVVNMLALGLAREFAPLMTAIIVSGRSGSAIASEIATMKFTEELDAIRTLGLNPLRFVVVPKFWAMVVSLPLLTVMALFIGLAGGFIVAVTYMDLSPETFFNQLLVSLMWRDVAAGIIKSVSFAIIITIVGVYRGMTFSGGADGVGRATTSSVVTSIFSIIVMDSIWGIVFYFKF